jgi:hypothetical protein
MMEVCKHHLDLLQDPERAEGGRLFDKEVDDAAGQVVSGLSLQRLVDLERKTHEMLRSGQPVDGEFWDLVLKKIHVEKAIVRDCQGCADDQAKLNSIHEVVLKNRLEQFKKRQREDAAKVHAELGDMLKTTAQASADNFGGDMHAEIGEIADDEEADDEIDEDDEVEPYDGSMSPKPVDTRTMQLEERRLPIIEEEDNLRALVG